MSVQNKQETAKIWLIAAATLGLFIVAFGDGMRELAVLWQRSEEYSYGWLVPPLAAYLAYQQIKEMPVLERSGTWLGVAMCILAGLVLLVGDLATLYIFVHYAMVLFIWGLFVVVFGLPAARRCWAPLFLLVFMIPLPPFLYNRLSGILQLISSELGVQVIRSCGISVYLEGNVIDLGNYQLQVVEACNGLRYLFPLMTFGFICAYLFKAPIWQRILLFVSTIPITVLMNSFRIGVIGVLVEYWGTSMAEGFLHDFEGWVIFMSCVGILFLEMWALTKLTQKGRTLRQVFWPEAPTSGAVSAGLASRVRGITSTPSTVVLLILAGLATTVSVIGNREEQIPERAHFSSFPLSISDWSGRRDQLEQKFVDILKFHDYILADYRNDSGRVNFYAAYYDSQRKGESAHSPRSCIPGGGWKIRSIEQVEIEDAKFAGRPAVVNRVEIQKGRHRQLVYYWFQQRGRLITSEYLVKANLVWDAVRMNRTDGALVRLTTAIDTSESWEKGDSRLADFARSISGKLETYIPG